MLWQANLLALHRLDHQAIPSCTTAREFDTTKTGNLLAPGAQDPHLQF